MESVARAAPLEEGATLELPLLLLRGVVLFPGETLPLKLHSFNHVRLIMTLASQQQRSGTPAHLGVLNTRRLSSTAPEEHPALMELCEGVGTTAELLEVQTADDWNVEEGLAGTARGRHRFKLIAPGTPGHGQSVS
jgi:Lon protease-like protein